MSAPHHRGAGAAQTPVAAHSGPPSPQLARHQARCGPPPRHASQPGATRPKLGSVPEITPRSLPVAGGQRDRGRLDARHRPRRSDAAGLRRAAGPAAPRRAARPGPRRRPDRPHRRAAGRPAGRDSPRAAGGSPPGRAGTCAARRACCPPTSTRWKRQRPGTRARSRSRSAGRGRWRPRSSWPAARIRRSPTRGRVADLTASLAEGVAAHVAEVRDRVPGAQVLLQLDEPALPAVLAGEVPTASGLNRLPVPEPSASKPACAPSSAPPPAFTLVHCCAMSVPFGMIKGAGADGVGCDLGKLRRTEEDALAEAVEAGLGILAGVLPGSDQPARRPFAAFAAGRDTSPGAEPPEPRDLGSGSVGPAPGQERARGLADTERAGARQPPSARQTAERVIELWRRMGWPTARGGPDPGRSASRARWC